MTFKKALLLSVIALICLQPGAEAALTARYSHTTTLLPEGNILITGGVNSAGAAITEVQMYNMSTNLYEVWGGGGPLDTARSSHTATLMSDGKVLIAGGFNAGAPLASLEICDPTTKICSAAGVATLTTAKGGHTAVLLSTGTNAGKVLICGGSDSATSLATDSCYLFDPATPAAIAAGGSMVNQRMGHTATLVQGGKVFVSGGKNTAGTYLPTCEMYEPNLNAWTPVDALNQGRVDHTATALGNGLVLIAGGYNAQNVVDISTGRAEDVWTAADTTYWGYGGDHQDLGSHGYLDGAELFDSKGGMMVIAESVYGVAPYRTSRHSAVLQPDGTWNMFGGYGNIVRTVFSASPVLDPDTIFYLTNTGLSTAIINSTSVVRFPLDISLARPVSGRLVDADAFFSRPLDLAIPTVSIENATIFMNNHSTAALDGLPVGTLIPDLDPAAGPGDFTNTVQLTSPSGDVSFEPALSMNSDASLYPSTLTVTSSALTFAAPINPGDPSKACSGTVVGKVALTLPGIYRVIRGLAFVKSGTISHADYSVSIDQSDLPAAVSIDAPSECDATTCVFMADITFPINAGLITNLSESTTIQTSPLNAAGSTLSLTFDLRYTAGEIHTGSNRPAFTYGRSDIVIREMIFSSALGFVPKDNTWHDLLDTAVSPTLYEPVFAQNTILTPAADTVVLGGRNCEAAPASDCLRSAKTFNARAARTVYIPVTRSTEGSSDWQVSEKLGSKRAYHTSTLLLNGQILTCGGSDGINPLATCELMDPATRRWSPSGSMSMARTKHTATLLPNGTVLTAGGATSPEGVTSSAEIYYPETGRWTPIASMTNARQDHTATLLPDGNILVAGGATLSTYSATSDLYITSAAIWMAGGTMIDPRALHTATLLKSGSVLISGGINGSAALAKTELYNFATRTFAAGPDLNMPRYYHTANLLRDGRVIVMGGSDNSGSQFTAEIYNGAAWAATPELTANRANHRSVLLPNGKVMATGGVIPGMVQPIAESYDPDFSSWFAQGKMTARAYHTSVLTRDNNIINIGGRNGSGYLDTTDISYFSYYPDLSALPSAARRQPEISTATASFLDGSVAAFNRGERVTLLSGTSNFHGITEAAGGGAGPMSSSYSNPRVYMQQIDNASGFMIDLSTRIYSLYGGVNTSANWGRTISSITIISPSAAGELPYGYYHMRVAANGQFSEGQVVQVSSAPRPAGISSKPTTNTNLIGSTSVQWTWTHTHTGPAADGFAVFNATDGVFVGVSTFGALGGAYTQSGLAPNSEVAIKVAYYNMGGYGQRSPASETYYTKAITPANLTVNYASFDTVSLSWNSVGNSGITAYEISSLAAAVDDATNEAAGWVVKVPFTGNHTSTGAVLHGLLPDVTYYFRVRAINGTPATQDGVRTGFSNHPSTRTVGNVNNLKGETQYPYSIYWSWARSAGTPSYRIEDITAGTTNAVLLSSAITNDYPSYTQTGLLPNTAHTVAVNAYVPTLGSGPQVLASLYTQAAQPYNGAVAHPTPNSLTLTWESGNPAGTSYRITGSPNSDFSGGTEFTVIKSSFAPEPSTFTWTGLTPSTRYYARVSALNSDNLETVPLSLGSAYTLPDTPTNLREIGIAMSGVTMTWDTGNNPGTTIYELRGSSTASQNGLSGYITTYLPFSAGQTSNVFRVTSLMTSTTYYFDVSARNAGGSSTGQALSARINTLSGPGGAPAGSIGGSSDPSADVTISGRMPDNRMISLSVPAGAYARQTAIAIAQFGTNSCNQNLAETPQLAVEIYTENGEQPRVPVSFTISYLAADAAKITPNISKLVIGRYNPASGECLPLETAINPGPRTITAKLNHFSVFQLVNKNAASDLSAVRVYPNPYYTNRGQGFVTIDNMPASTDARIYTLSGDKVWEGTAGTTGLLTWDATNSSGVLVASGIYLVALDSTGGKKVIKIAVER